jgi:YHS domain-containing protein
VIRWILLAILILLVARAFWRVMDGILEAAGGTSRSRPRTPGVKLVRDPVCGTYVAPANARSLTTKGVTYYFCSDQCRTQFRAS